MSLLAELKYIGMRFYKDAAPDGAERLPSKKGLDNFLSPTQSQNREPR
jgi:hypothetical protein